MTTKSSNSFLISVIAGGGPNKATANSYDAAWRDGPQGWIERAKWILHSNSGQVEGMVIHIGDSLSRHPSMGAWAQSGAGKTAEDVAICNWMHAGASSQAVDSIDGFALAAPYFCAARSYTVGDGRGAWDFRGLGGMPDITDQTQARAVMEDCGTYPNDISLITMLSALERPQFALITVNLAAADPGVIHPDFIWMHDQLEARGIVPIIITYTYRNVFDSMTETFNGYVDQYNVALYQFAQDRGYALIDLNQEMLNRIPLSGRDTDAMRAWDGRFLSGDGVHYTGYGGGYSPTSDPYSDGGDPATHTTGLALTYNGYGLKGWLIVQKMKQIKQLVIDT
jgi:hypothetical protein